MEAFLSTMSVYRDLKFTELASTTAVGAAEWTSGSGSKCRFEGASQGRARRTRFLHPLRLLHQGADAIPAVNESRVGLSLSWPNVSLMKRRNYVWIHVLADHCLWLYGIVLQGIVSHGLSRITTCALIGSGCNSILHFQISTHRVPLLLQAEVSNVQPAPGSLRSGSFTVRLQGPANLWGVPHSISFSAAPSLDPLAVLDFEVCVSYGVALQQRWHCLYSFTNPEASCINIKWAFPALD